MKSHPNYKGYDAYKGNPRAVTLIERDPKGELAESIGTIHLDDLCMDVDPKWVDKLNELRVWANQHGMRLAVTPYDYQLAKVYGDGFTIVLWNSRIKGSKRRYIRPAFEGVSFGREAEDAMENIKKKVEEIE